MQAVSFFFCPRHMRASVCFEYVLNSPASLELPDAQAMVFLIASHDCKQRSGKNSAGTA